MRAPRRSANKACRQGSRGNSTVAQKEQPRIDRTIQLAQGTPSSTTEVLLSAVIFALLTTHFDISLRRMTDGQLLLRLTPSEFH